MLDIAISHPKSPGDVVQLKLWLDHVSKRGVSKIAVFGKTEGPATLNDFSRDLAQLVTDAALREAAANGLVPRAWRLFSTGCEGIASPLTVMIAEVHQSAPQVEVTGLAIGLGRSEPLPAFPRCDLTHIDTATAVVRNAMVDAGLSQDQVSLVLIKSPVLMPGSGLPGAISPSRHSGSTGSSRGAAAIGAGVALGEINRLELGSDPVGRSATFASRVMAFSGTETDSVEVLVMGERPGGDPRWRLRSALLHDLLDSEGIARLRAQTRGAADLVFFKAGIAGDGALRGRRTTILTSELPADKQLRAAASGIVAAHFGTLDAFVSGGAEHQAPPGGCLCAILCRTDWVGDTSEA